MLSKKSACASNESPTSKISELFFESPSQIAHFKARAQKKDMLFVLNIMQITFVMEPIVDCQQSVSTLRVWALKRKRAMFRARAYLVPAPGT